MARTAHDSSFLVFIQDRKDIPALENKLLLCFDVQSFIAVESLPIQVQLEFCLANGR